MSDKENKNHIVYLRQPLKLKPYKSSCAISASLLVTLMIIYIGYIYWPEDIQEEIPYLQTPPATTPKISTAEKAFIDDYEYRVNIFLQVIDQSTTYIDVEGSGEPDIPVVPKSEIYFVNSTVLNLIKTSNISKKCESDQCYSCDSEWDLYNNNCYYFSDRLENQNNSQRWCQLYNADLVSIRSKCEQNFITNLSKTRGGYYFWIGLNRNHVSGRWVWPDGTNIGTAYWKDNIPSGLHRRNCSGLNSVIKSINNWDESDCYGIARYICKKPTFVIKSQV
ncbi:putative C-type lectin-like protein [Namao virus]|nr:putative C-type lectin-like protein [Namao virus]